MNNYEKIYWLTRLDGLHHFFVGMAIVSTILIVGIIIWATFSRDFDEFHHGLQLKLRIKTRSKLTSKVKYLVFTFFLVVLVSVFLPTQREAVLIIAGGKTIDFIQKDTAVNKIPEQTTMVVSKFLEKQLKELDKKTDK